MFPKLRTWSQVQTGLHNFFSCCDHSFSSDPVLLVNLWCWCTGSEFVDTDGLSFGSNDFPPSESWTSFNADTGCYTWWKDTFLVLGRLFIKKLPWDKRHDPNGFPFFSEFISNFSCNFPETKCMNLKVISSFLSSSATLAAISMSQKTLP